MCVKYVCMYVCMCVCLFVTVCVCSGVARIFSVGGHWGGGGGLGFS